MSESTDQVPQLQAKWRPYPAYKDPGVEWLGEIPEHWAALPLKRVASRMQAGSTPPTAELRYYEEGEVPWFTPESFDMDIAITRPAKLIARSAVKEGAARLFEAGSVMLVTIASIGKVGVIEQPASCNQQIMSISFRPDEVSPRFAAYQIKPLEAALQGIAPSSTVAILGQDEVGYLPFALPPVGEQRAIADFLDRETAKIDPLVEKNQRLIELLVEKRTALITQAVTKGLDPSIPMKDSGIEWLGKIPEHWELLSLRRIVRKFVDYRGKTPAKSASGVPLVTARNVTNGRLDMTVSEEFIPDDLYDKWMVRGFPELGDVLVTTEAPLGECAQIQDTGAALAQRLILLKCDKQVMTNDYLKYHFLSAAGQGELWSRATGSTAVGIKAWRLKETLITVPSISEQRAIAESLDRETTKIGALISKSHEAIDKLREYRTALISAAVTGKIDVRQEAAS